MLTGLFTLLFMARAGGGGSDSGGSGGVLVLAGYIPSYYLGKLVKRLLPRRAELIVSGSFAVVASIALLVLGFFAGTLGLYIMLEVIIGVWVGWSAAFFGVWDRLLKRSKKAKQELAQAATTDAAWNEPVLLDTAQKTFLRYQYDWSRFDTQSMQQYLTPRYAMHAYLLMMALHELGRRNSLDDVRIMQQLLVAVHDDSDNARDSFTVAFEAAATDRILTSQGTVLFEDTRPFTEYWQFVRSGQGWLLDGITQQTQDLSAANQSLMDFAARYQMYYSLDMGWLLLPVRGLLAGRGQLGKSDVNNHVIGTYQQRIFQLYTFTPIAVSRNSSGSWLMMQITLPKAYGGIIVQQKRKFFSAVSYLKPGSDYQRHSFEWPDFNKRYEVYATDADRLAAFELINPGFMAYLYDHNPNIGIEVADNVLYLFRYLGATVTTTSPQPQEYEVMLEIALRAFKELQL